MRPASTAVHAAHGHCPSEDTRIPVLLLHCYMGYRVVDDNVWSANAFIYHECTPPPTSTPDDLKYTGTSSSAPAAPPLPSPGAGVAAAGGPLSVVARRRILVRVRELDLHALLRSADVGGTPPAFKKLELELIADERQQNTKTFLGANIPARREIRMG